MATRSAVLLVAVSIVVGAGPREVLAGSQGQGGEQRSSCTLERAVRRAAEARARIRPVRVSPIASREPERRVWVDAEAWVVARPERACGATVIVLHLDLPPPSAS